MRTRLTESSTDAFFVLERLLPYPLSRLREASDDFVGRLRHESPKAEIESWIIEP